MKELDVVILTKDMPEVGLKAGAIGAIVLVHKDGEAFMVEFDNGRLVTVHQRYLVAKDTSE